MKNLLLFGLLFYSALSFSQDQDSLTDRRAKIYFLDGRIPMNTRILEKWDDQDSITTKYSDWSSIYKVPKSEVHYIYYNGEHYLINEITCFQDTEKVRLNLSLYKKQTNIGWAALGVGTGALLSGFIINDIQTKRFNDGKVTLEGLEEWQDVIKVLTYAGYSFMLLGVGINIDASKYLKRGNIDITPVGIRVKF